MFVSGTFGLILGIPLEMILPTILLLVLLVLGTPVAYATGIAGTVGLLMVLDSNATLGYMQTVTNSSIADYLFSPLPLFILMAELLRTGDFTKDMFRVTYVWIGHIKGGLAYATTIASGGMAALTGSTTATAAAMANIAVPEMEKYGYDPRLALGSVCAGGTFATMIPPSIAVIVYGVITETSIAGLFMAGVIPGIVTILAYGVTIYVWGRMDPDLIKGGTPDKAPLGERMDALKPVWPSAIIVILVIGGLYAGVVTATEAGALGAIGTLLVGAGLGRIRYPQLKDGLAEAAETTAMIFLIFVGALIFGRYLAVSGVSRALITYVGELPIGPIWIMILILLIYIAMGTVMSSLAIIIITVPVAAPLISSLGFHPIWFGILLMKVIEIGLITPPLGLNVFVGASSVDAEVEVGFRGSARFLVADVFIAIGMILFPGVVLWLPNQLL